MMPASDAHDILDEGRHEAILMLMRSVNDALDAGAVAAPYHAALRAALERCGGGGMSAPVDVLAVMDADRRAVALLSDEYYDTGKSNLAEKWSDHLSVHDEARAAVAKLIEESAGSKCARK